MRYAQKITALYDESIEKCAGQSLAGTAQRVRISTGGMSPAMQRTFFKLLADYGETHPDVRLEYQTLRERESNIANLLANKVDIALVATTSGNPTPKAVSQGVVCMPCYKAETVLWASRYNYLLHGETLKVEDLDHCHFPLINDSLYDFHKLSLETSLGDVGATPLVSPYYADSFEDFLLNAFDDGDLYVANRSTFTRSQAFTLVPDRAIVPFKPAVYSTAYLGRRKDETSQAVLEPYDHLVASARNHPPLEMD